MRTAPVTTRYWLHHLLGYPRGRIPIFPMFGGPWFVVMSDFIRAFNFFLAIIIVLTFARNAAQRKRQPAHEVRFRRLVTLTMSLFLFSMIYTEVRLRGTPMSLRLLVDTVALLSASRVANRMRPQTERMIG